MIVYRDRCFCGYWEDCEHGNACTRALTAEVEARAKAVHMEISQFASEPDCLVKKNLSPKKPKPGCAISQPGSISEEVE